MNIRKGLESVSDTVNKTLKNIQTDILINKARTRQKSTRITCCRPGANCQQHRGWS